MAQVSESHADSDFSSGYEDIQRSSINNPVITEDSKTKSLVRKVKEKAKGTVRKIRDKVKKGSGQGHTEDHTDSDDDLEISDPQTVSQPKEDPRTGTSDEVKETQLLSMHDGTEEACTGKSQDDPLSSFARSGQSVPTDYSEPHATIDETVDAVMPPPVIEPTSVSEVGEESSSSLGGIPEAKDEEKAAVAEVQAGGPDSDVGGFRKTFDQKNLQAIDGLPKPRGFDTNDESSVTSNNGRGDPEDGGRGISSRDLADSTSQPRRLDEDQKEPHPPGSHTELQESMFSSNATHDLTPNEPSTADAVPVSGTDTSSRGFEAGMTEPSEFGTDGHGELQQPPPAEKAELHESMFSSAITSDLTPSPADWNNRPNANDTVSGGDATIGVLSREGEQEILSEPTSGLGGSRHGTDLSSPSQPEETSQDGRDGKIVSEGIDKMSDERSAEDFFDTASDQENLASQRSLQSGADNDSRHEVRAESNEQDRALTEPTQNAMDDVQDSGRTSDSPTEKDAVSDPKVTMSPKDNEATSTSSLTSALASVVGTVSSKVGYYPISSEEEAQAPVGEIMDQATTADRPESVEAITPSPSAASKTVSSLVAKAIDAVTAIREDKTTKVNRDDELPPFVQ